MGITAALAITDSVNVIPSKAFAKYAIILVKLEFC
jgi:hypothetical protein